MPKSRTPSPASSALYAPLREDDEKAQFHALQATLLSRWESLQQRRDSDQRTVVIIPSLSLEGLGMAKIPGVTHYEERMLFTLSLLRNPRARLIYLTSQPLHPATVDYQLSLLQGIPMAHAKARLNLLSTYDASPRTLTEKILERPRLIARIKGLIDPETTHMTCFTVSPLERRLAVALQIPLYGVDPELLPLGTKSGARKVFRAAKIPMPAGVEDVRTRAEVVEAIAEMSRADPALERVVIKHDMGFSGEGNAVLDLGRLALGERDAVSTRKQKIDAHLEAIRSAESFPDWESFGAHLQRHGGVVEAFVEGKIKRAPSGQIRINPRGEVEAISTHDQLVGGPDGQTYIGCRFPADEDYRLQVQDDALRVGEALRDQGVIGRAAVDFVAVRREEPAQGWDHYAIEINLRMSGTTHPLMLMRMLNAGRYDPATGLYFSARNEARFYVASDVLSSPRYRGLLVEDLLDIAAVHNLHYKPWTETGAIFHLTGALSQFGKIGVTAMGKTLREAQELFDAVRSVLDQATS